MNGPRALVTGAVMVTLIALAVSVARMVPITHRFCTDADAIKEPVDTARTRDILWQPARGLDELVNTSAGDYEPRLSADGLTLFFVRGRAGDNADIYVSRRTAVGWTTPAPLFDVNSAYEDLGPEPASDGRSIHFYSDRPVWKKKYPDREHKRGPAYTGISNARPETVALSKPPVDYKNLPFDPLEFISHLDKLPFDAGGDPGFGE